MHLNTVAAAAFAINFAPALGYVYSTQSMWTTLLGSNSVSPVKTSSYVLTIPITFTKRATVTPRSTITPPPVTSTSTVTTVVRDRQRLSRSKMRIPMTCKFTRPLRPFPRRLRARSQRQTLSRYGKPSYSSQATSPQRNAHRSWQSTTTSTVSRTETDTTTTTNTPVAVTMPTAAGFTPVATEGSYSPKKRSESYAEAAVPAIRGGTLQGRILGLRPRAVRSGFSTVYHR